MATMSLERLIVCAMILIGVCCCSRVCLCVSTKLHTAMCVSMSVHGVQCLPDIDRHDNLIHPFLIQGIEEVRRLIAGEQGSIVCLVFLLPAAEPGDLLLDVKSSTVGEQLNFPVIAHLLLRTIYGRHIVRSREQRTA